MAAVQFTRVSLAFGDRDILKNVSLYLSAGSRACLAGANGSGKSTLMKVIAGKLSPDSGERAIQKRSRISYLPQAGIVHRGRTLREEAETAYDGILLLLDAMEETGRTLEKTKSDDGRTAVLLEEYHRLHETIEDSGYYRREASIAMVLEGLGFAPDDLDRNAGEFSGGWQMRIALAKALLERPDILLLDEPTNYLDIEARTWLEGWLARFNGGCLLVSHDRYFLDVTMNEVYELFQGNLKRYAGNYSAYEKVRAVEIESLMKRYAEQQEEIAKAEDLIRRFRYKASKAAMVQERIKKLEKMESRGLRIEIPESLKKISIAFPPPPHAGRIALTLEGVGKSYGPRRVFSGLDLVLESGERLLAVGRNGAGKTTLLKILAGVDGDFEGSLRCGAGITAGYFSQDAAETLQGEKTALAYIEEEAFTALIPRVRDMLGSFLFRGDDVYKSLSVLSGGEKSRLALLRMLLKPINLLILDEPTNHLDLYSKDILLDTLKRFTGTIVFVSHDRSFMEALSTKTLELRSRNSSGGSAHRLFYGGYGYYLERTGAEAAEPALGRDAEDAAAAGGDRTETATGGYGPAHGPETSPPEREAPSGIILVKAGQARPLTAGERRAEEKQRRALVRRLERQEEAILKALGDLEAEKSRLAGELTRPEVYSSGERAWMIKAGLDGTAAEIEAKIGEWELKAAELESARSGLEAPFPAD
ncbi:MAG: ATP-binding cassette domain-containing protein [Treponema sp.]|jgi:ATP-binding cassette subfamily F protein 3|nr:ATP-binding cassette domain-containing protein [Treponema sp.]